MPNPVRAIPEGYHSITPALTCKGAAGAIDFYKSIFGATEIMRMPGPDGKVMHGEIRIGDSVLFVSDEKDGVSDSDLAVHDLAVRPGHAHDFGGAKDGLVKINGACCTFAGQRRRNGMIPLGDSTDRIWHDCLLGRLDVRAPETGAKPAIACA